MRVDQQVESIEWARFVLAGQGEQIERIRRLRLQLERPVQFEISLGEIAAAQESLSEVIKNLECTRLKSVSFFEFERGRLVLLFRSKQDR